MNPTSNINPMLTGMLPYTQNQLWYLNRIANSARVGFPLLPTYIPPPFYGNNTNYFNQISTQFTFNSARNQETISSSAI